MCITPISGVIFMPIVEAQAFFNPNQDVTAIEVFTANPDRIDLFRKMVADAAGRPIFLVDWRQRNATFFSALVRKHCHRNHLRETGSEFS